MKSLSTPYTQAYAFASPRIRSLTELGPSNTYSIPRLTTVLISRLFLNLRQATNEVEDGFAYSSLRIERSPVFARNAALSKPSASLQLSRYTDALMSRGKDQEEMQRFNIAFETDGRRDSGL